jgi:two-component system, OmpR family, response regulator
MDYSPALPENEEHFIVKNQNGGIMVNAMKVLVVEDNKKLARFLQRALQEEGYIVDTVEEGSEAIERSSNIEYDLVILDWMLPGTDGLAVCRALRGRGSTVPILMLTARAEVAERILGLDAGADDYLPKPFDLGELLARVRALGRRGSGTEGVVRVGPLVLDRLERHATLNGQLVELTPREFALLTYLARESGRVVPRSELLRKVWETTYDPGSNVVDAHIKKLREKLGDHSTLIETVRGVGYRMGSAESSAAS